MVSIIRRVIFLLQPLYISRVCGNYRIDDEITQHR